MPDLEQNNLYRDGGIPEKTLRQSGVADQQIAVFLCPSDAYSNRGPRFDAGNLDGFPVGQTNYKGVSGANWGDDLEGNGGPDFPTEWRNPDANGSFDGAGEELEAQGATVGFRLRRARPGGATTGWLAGRGLLATPPPGSPRWSDD